MKYTILPSILHIASFIVLPDLSFAQTEIDRQDIAPDRASLAAKRVRVALVAPRVAGVVSVSGAIESNSHLAAGFREAALSVVFFKEIRNEAICDQACIKTIGGKQDADFVAGLEMIGNHPHYSLRSWMAQASTGEFVATEQSWFFSSGSSGLLGAIRNHSRLLAAQMPRLLGKRGLNRVPSIGEPLAEPRSAHSYQKKYSPSNQSIRADAGGQLADPSRRFAVPSDTQVFSPVLPPWLSLATAGLGVAGLITGSVLLAIDGKDISCSSATGSFSGPICRGQLSTGAAGAILTGIGAIVATAATLAHFLWKKRAVAELGE